MNMELFKNEDICNIDKIVKKEDEKWEDCLKKSLEFLNDEQKFSVAFTIFKKGGKNHGYALMDTTDNILKEMLSKTSDESVEQVYLKIIYDVTIFTDWLISKG